MGKSENTILKQPECCSLENSCSIVNLGYTQAG